MIRVPPNKINETSSPWTFSTWGMDVIGPIEPVASNGHRFILVAIDYFIKWVEAVSYKTVSKKVVAEFVRDRIGCRFGVPESIITDNAANLNSDLMKAMCETFKIKHRNSTTYRSQMNGAVEVANKNIKKILRKMVDTYKQWNEKLSFALLGYRTTIRTSNKATPYLLFYGTEAVISTKVEIPSLRIIQEAEFINAEWVWNRYEQLALIDGKRMNAVCHGQLYLNKMARAFNKKVRSRAKAFSGEFAEKTEEIEKAESTWPKALRKAESLEIPNIPCDLYEEWIHTEAQLDVLRELHVAGSISAADFEGAHVKARKARIACGYDSATPRPGEEDEDDDDAIDRLEDEAWYDSIYPPGKD
nr:uncharacterized protein K02A2.6-like [Nicotiana tomentosiformis]